jgi:hypothetical protein
MRITDFRPLFSSDNRYFIYSTRNSSKDGALKTIELISGND